MNILEKIRDEIDNKKIGKRYILKYSDIIPSFNIIAQDEEGKIIKTTVLEYIGKGIYKDLITGNIIADNSIYDILETIDFQFNLFNIDMYLKEISKKESDSYLESITDQQKETLNTTILKARNNTIKNTIARKAKTKQKSLQ